MNEITLEALARETGHTYRTCKTRLDRAKVKPVRSDKKSAYYAKNQAVRAVVTQGEDGQDARRSIERIEELIAKQITPSVFDLASMFARIITGHLRTDHGFSKADCIRTLQIMLLAWTHVIDDLMGCLPGEEIGYAMPEWVAELQDLGPDHAAAIAAFVEKHWPDTDDEP